MVDKALDDKESNTGVHILVVDFSHKFLHRNEGLSRDQIQDPELYHSNMYIF